MREPATSCTTCGVALLPAEVLYTAHADVVCAACFGPVTAPRALPPAREGIPRTWRQRSVPHATRTARERHLTVLRWSLLFAIVAASSLHIRQIALMQLRMLAPRVWIDSPDPGARVGARLIVRGGIETDTIARPLWLVASSARGRELLRYPIIVDPFGTFAVALDLPGPRGARYWLSVVSADEAANGWLESAAEAAYPARARPAAALAARPHCGAFAGLPTLPPGTAVLASTSVVLLDSLSP